MLRSCGETKGDAWVWPDWVVRFSCLRGAVIGQEQPVTLPKNKSVAILSDSGDGLCNSLGGTAGHQSLPDAMLLLDEIASIQRRAIARLCRRKINPLSGMGDHYRIDGSSIEALSAVIHDTSRKVLELTSSSLLFANL